MCTAIRYGREAYFFGRTLDYNQSFGETVVLMPRKYPLLFSNNELLNSHYAVIGMAADLVFSGGYPLFYDGINEKGLAMAGLNFVKNAVYGVHILKKQTLSVHDLIPYILGKCSTVEEARSVLSNVVITDTPFHTPTGSEIPAARLHWMIADKTSAIVVESVATGLMIYTNPVGVLTNDPSFPHQLMTLIQSEKKNVLPTDYLSPSRFIRGAAALRNAPASPSSENGVDTFFRIMKEVTLPKEGTLREDGSRWFTMYTCCMDGMKGQYFCIPQNSKKTISASFTETDINNTVCTVCFSLSK